MADHAHAVAITLTCGNVPIGDEDRALGHWVERTAVDEVPGAILGKAIAVQRGGAGQGVSGPNSRLTARPRVFATVRQSGLWPAPASWPAIRR